MERNISLGDGDPGRLARAALQASIETKQALEQVIAQQVAACRRAGVGWQEIAAITGVSKPTAQSRWREDGIVATTTERTWTLQPGDAIRRKDLHADFGGNGQGGIAACKETDEVLLFAEAGEDHGYLDGAQPDGTYDYTGEGQNRDQTMTRGNKAIRDHANNGKHLRLFQGARGEVTYLGEYEYVTHRTRRIPRGRGYDEHDVIVFTLRPTN